MDLDNSKEIMRKSQNFYGVDVKLTDERRELMEGGWEHLRMKSMMANIKKGDVIFDIGAEQGDMSIIMAKKTGKIVLFEPSPVMWPHIRQNFEANKIKPLDCYAGFACNVINESPEIVNYDPTIKDGYPVVSYNELDNTRGFRHLHEESHATLQITIDEYCKITQIFPDMITIDVEGSEFAVVEGMKKTLEDRTPIVYISVHHDFMAINYKKYFNEMYMLFDELNYKCEFLNHDHESHYVWYKKSFNTVKK